MKGTANTTGTESRKSTYGAAQFALELDGHHAAGLIRSVDGGGVKSERITYKSGGQHEHWHQLGQPKYDDIKIDFGMAMSEEFYQWIAAFFRGEAVRKNGAILAGDFHFAERARREFYDAIISELTFPKLDSTDRSPCYMTATLVPESVRFQPASGQSLPTCVSATEAQKLWTAANFELAIDHIADETSLRRVTKIDSFTIKQQVMEYRSGDRRDAARVPEMIEFPNLSFYLPEADSWPLVEHLSAYVIDGELQPDGRHTGNIVVRDHGGSALCTVTLRGVEILAITPEKSDASSEEIKLTKVELVVEGMEFDYHSTT